jgi:hypothetical protein
MVWDDGLVGTARDIAATDNSPLRVIAGPSYTETLVAWFHHARSE